MKKLILPALAALAAVAALVPAAFSAPAAQTITVSETSYRIKLSAAPRAGTVKFAIRNLSDDGHDLWLKGGGKTYRSRVIGRAGRTTLTTTLRKGVRYTFWCGVGDHREEGMSGSFVAR